MISSRNALVSVLAVGLALVAAEHRGHAADSTWLLCQGTADYDGDKLPFVASVLEHRGGNGDTRDLGVIFIHGEQSVHGTILGKTVGEFPGKKVALTMRTSSAKPRVVFKGTLLLAADWASVTLDGAMDIGFDERNENASPLAKFHAALTCAQL